MLGLIYGNNLRFRVAQGDGLHDAGGQVGRNFIPAFLRGIEHDMVFPPIAQPKFYIRFYGKALFTPSHFFAVGDGYDVEVERMHSMMAVLAFQEREHHWQVE